MHFTAELKMHTATWKMWRQHGRVGGEIGGVKFAWIPGNRYVTGDLGPIQVKALAQAFDVAIVGTEVGVRTSTPAAPPAAGVDVPSSPVPPVGEIAAVPTVRTVRTLQLSDLTANSTTPRGRVTGRR